MANYGVVIDNVTEQVELSGSTDNNHLIYLLPAAPVMEDQSFQVYEGQVTGTVIGHVISTDPNNITYSILSGNTSNRFALGATTGILTTNAVLDYHTQPTGYTLTVQVSNNLVPSLTDTALISIEVLQVFTICTSNVPSFSATTLNDLVGYMTVGVVQTASGTLGDYLIEWRLNSTTGTTVFITGNASNSDTNKQSSHPIVYEPVQAGILYPVLRYIEINSVKYSAYSFSAYGLYSPDLLTCLNHVDVVSMSCSNGTTGTTYGHSIIYTNSTMPSSQANRSMSYALNTDGSSKEIAYRFDGYLIADRIKVSYVTDSGATPTIINDWVVGTDCTGTTYTSLPKLFDSQTLETTISLTGYTYVDGDYLLFEVFPAYNAPGATDTNWQLQIKCFDTSDRFSLDWISISSQVIDTGATMTFTYDSTNCQYTLTFDTAQGWWPDAYYSDIITYTNGQVYYGNLWYQTGLTLNIPAYTGASYTWINGGMGANYVLNGTLNITVSGTTTVHWVKYTFTNGVDYYNYKSSYTGMTTQSHWTDKGSDPSKINYYKIYYYTHKISMTTGDTYTTINMYLFGDAVFNFNDTTKEIKIDTAPIQPWLYTGLSPCDKTVNNIGSLQYAINQIYSGWTWQSSYDTIWGYANPFDFLYYFYYDYSSSTGYDYAWAYTISGTTGDVIITYPQGWYDPGAGGMYFYKVYMRVIITNLGDALNNYEVYTFLDATTGLPGTWRLIKKVGT